MMSFGGRSERSSIASCSVLLKELEQLWTDIGETEGEKDRMLLDMERECFQVYRRKVDETANSKARLHQSVAAKEAELATLTACLGETSLNSPIELEKRSSLKEQLAYIAPLVEDLKIKREERLKQFAEIRIQIEKISAEISGYSNLNNSVNSMNLEEHDLSLRKLSEYQTNLRTLQKEKSERLKNVLESVNEVHTLCGVLGLDFSKTVGEVHPTLHGSILEQSTNIREQSTNISDTTLEGLDRTILKLKTERKVRLQKLKDVAASLYELWSLMDTMKQEQVNFAGITLVVNSAESEIVEPGALSLDVIQQTFTEVERLTKLKASRMKELVLKRRQELEDICSETHIQPDSSTAADKANAMIDSGLLDPCELLSSIETQIIRARDEVFSRKEIIQKIGKWLSACEEENWLEDYNRDQNRYSAGRGAHINLKRAERARVMVNKIPVMVDSLISKTLAWEDEKRKLFLYDGVRLVSILEDYKLTRQQKEEEKKRARDQKKLQDMLLAEKEAIFGSKPSPRRSSSFRASNSYRANGNGSMTPTPRRNSAGSATPELLTPRSYSGRQNGYFKDMRRLSTAPLNFVAIPKEDTISFSSVCGSEPESPPQR